MSAALAAVLVGIGCFVLSFHVLLRFGLRAPRVVERTGPESRSLPFREVWLPTVRRRRLFGWLIPAGQAAPAVAILHGWGGNAEMMLPLARPLFEAGYTVLLFDARSHGRSDGDSFASLPRFAEDLDRALDWLLRQPEVDPRRVAVIGHSVGAGAALLAASRRRDLAAVASLAAFAHPRSMMRRWLAGMGIPYLPLGWYILRYVQWTIGHRFDDIAPENTIRRLACPVLLVHGRDDATVPLADAQSLFAGRRGDGVRLLVLEGGHESSGELETAMGEILAFLAEAMPPPAKSQGVGSIPKD